MTSEQFFNVEGAFGASGILFGLMLITALLTREGGVRRGNCLLAGALACMLSYLLGIILLRQPGVFDTFLPALLVAPILVAPALLLGYVRAMIIPGFTLTWQHLWHLLPLLAFASFLVVSPWLGVETDFEALQISRGQWPPDSTIVIGILLYTLHVFYFLMSLAELHGHRRIVSGVFSYQERVTLHWLRGLVGVGLLMSGIGLSVSLLRMVPALELWPRTLFSVYMILTMYYLVGYMAIHQPAIFASTESAHAETDAIAGGRQLAADSFPKYETTGLSDDATSEYWNRLQAYMSEKRPFLDPKLRIADLAIQLDMPVYHLSQTINRKAGQSFFEYINRYRVETAIQMLESDPGSVTTIAFEAGFNSESAFYRYFKRLMGTTPKQFRRNLQRVPREPSA